MGEWVANDIHLQTTASSYDFEDLHKKHLTNSDLAGHWVFRLSHFRWLRVWVNDFFPTARCTLSLPGFSDLPCRWSLAIKLKLGGILKFNPTLRGCFKIDDHGPTNLPENWPHCHHWYLSAKIPKAKEIQEESSVKKKATLQLKEKEIFKNQANCDFRNDKTLLSQCVQYAVVWLPGFGSFREPPSSPSGIVCWYTSNVTNWLA